MRDDKCALAACESVEAFYHGGTLAIAARGEVPTPCYDVTIKRGLLDVEPPQFSIVQCLRPGICSGGTTPYTARKFFAIGMYRPKIDVFHVGGKIEVPVQQIADRPPAEMQVTASGGGEVPFPFGFLPPSAFESEPGRISTGYSEAFDFREAFFQAIATLPDDRDQYPDQLRRFNVIEIGAEFGGVAGFQHLFVRVQREPEPFSPKGRK
jgi:hypothetical protein